MIDEVLEKAADFIIPFEGFSSEPYKCPADVWTIGYGTTRGVNAGTKPITEERGRYLMIEDLKEINSDINHVVKTLINKNQKIALLSFVYNLGIGNFKTSTLLRKLNHHQFEEAANEFKKWVYAGGKELAGLVKRRKAEAELFLKPDKEIQYDA